MKVETIIFAICSGFFVVVAPFYWFVARDVTGTTALVMTALLAGLIAFFLGVHAKRIQESGDLRPEDLRDAEMADGAGEFGFYPPYSWWPLWAALALSTIAAGVVIGWWMAIIGGVFGLLALAGWVFEYYRGVHAH